MEATVKERLVMFIKNRGLSQKRFEAMVGLSNGYVNNISKGLGASKMAEISLRFPELNQQWLLTGEGEMLNSDDEIAKQYTKMCISQMADDTAISKMENDCEDAEVMESFPILPEVVAESQNTNIEAYIEENSSELERVNPSSLLSASHAAERILRTSMLPTFQPEDIVFVRFLPDRMKLCDGDIYYLNCKNRPTMIRRIKFEPDNRLRLVAQNPQYGDVIISREDIINVGTIVGMLRLTFGDQYSEIEAIRRQKDEQIEIRDAQIDNFLSMQRDLISEIREQGKRSARDRERMDALIDKLLAN
jgi:phage repressor protein C with HTH and peptisase S24 domain